MGITSNYNLPYPELTDKANIPNDMKKLAEKVEESLELKTNKTESNKDIAELTQSLSRQEEKINDLENELNLKVDTSKLEEELENIEKVDNLQSKLINGLEKELEPNTVKGTNIHIPDSAEARAKMIPVANTYQESREGYNLYNYKDVSSVLDASVDDDGWITFSKDNTDGTVGVYANYYTKVSDTLKPATDYTIICEIKEFSGSFNRFMPISTVGSATSQFTDTYRIPYSDISNNIKKIIVMKTLDDFSLSASMLRTTIAFDAGQSGSITFRLSVLEDTSVTEDTFIYEAYGATPSPSIPSPISYVRGKVGEEENVYEVKKSNSDESEFETFPLNLKDYKLAEAGDSKDHFDITYVDENGYKKIIRLTHTDRIKFYDFTGEEIFSLTTSGNSFRIYADDILRNINTNENADMLSNMYKIDTWQNRNHRNSKGTFAQYDNSIGFDKGDFETIEDFKAHLTELYNSGTPLQIAYPLATPIITEVTDTTLIFQLEALLNAMTYSEVTNISTSKSLYVEEVADLKVSVEYFKSARLERKELADRITVLEEKVNGLLSTSSVDDILENTTESEVVI